MCMYMHCIQSNIHVLSKNADISGRHRINAQAYRYNISVEFGCILVATKKQRTIGNWIIKTNDVVDDRTVAFVFINLMKIVLVCRHAFDIDPI